MSYVIEFEQREGHETAIPVDKIVVLDIYEMGCNTGWGVAIRCEAGYNEIKHFDTEAEARKFYQGILREIEGYYSAKSQRKAFKAMADTWGRHYAGRNL